MSELDNSACNHAIGVAYDEYADGGAPWLIYASDSNWSKRNIEIEFGFCPLCGEKLEAWREPAEVEA